MDEDIDVTPMRPVREILDELEERFDLESLARGPDPCPDCYGTGTELIVENNQTFSRPCRHIG